MSAGLSLSDIARRLGGEVAGDGNVTVFGMATLDEAGPGDLAFLANPRYRNRLSTTRAAAVIVGPGDRDATALPRIVLANPYAGYARAVSLFHPPRAVRAGIHPTAVVDPAATVAQNAEVGAHAFIAARAVVGERAVIGPGSIVSEGARIGEETRLVARVTVYEQCVVGARCILHAGCVVGADGFGMAPEAGRWIKIPQVGRAVIGDDVEIGANSAVDRGALGDTVVEEGVKIDNLVQIGHNCRIGAHTVIAGCAGIAGSTTIGRHCMIGGGAGIIGHLTLADRVSVSAMSFVTRSIAEAGTVSSGIPAEPHARWMRSLARLRRLDRPKQADTPGDDHDTDGP